MEVLSLAVNELPDELVSEGKKLEFKNIVDMPVFDVVNARWVVRRKGPDCVRVTYVTKVIARTKGVANEFFARTPQVSSFICRFAKASAKLQQH